MTENQGGSLRLLDPTEQDLMDAIEDLYQQYFELTGRQLGIIEFDDDFRVSDYVGDMH